MNEQDLKTLVDKLHGQEIGPLEAFAALTGEKRFDDLDFVKLDKARQSRCGFPEFIYGQGKTVDQIATAIRGLRDSNQAVLVTRLESEVAKDLLALFPEAVYDADARIISIKEESTPNRKGQTLILTAGTTDLPVALEAKHTIEICGAETVLIPDVGVAGIHRLLSKVAILRRADVIIAVAGMEGALPSVVAGMVDCPVLAVPTSVGYGTSFNGVTALLSMLNSCANGVSVLNIDNGFGAACAALRILATMTLKNRQSAE